jgi:HEPN domain-containing protein
MTPQEDARVLLALVDRHLRALRLNLDPAYPDEEWGFTAQQAVEKLLKVRIVLRDERPPFTHGLIQSFKSVQGSAAASPWPAAS